MMFGQKTDQSANGLKTDLEKSSIRKLNKDMVDESKKKSVTSLKARFAAHTTDVMVKRAKDAG